MALDNAQFMSELSITDPPGTDPLSEGDDQIRTSKRTQLQSFPNVDKAVTTTADQLNDVAIKSVFNNFLATNTFNAVTTFGAQVHAQSGSAAAPSYAFTSSNDAGMYRLSSTGIAFAQSGVDQLHLTTQQAQFFQNIRAIAGSAGAPSYSFTGDTTTGMFRDTPNRISFAAAGNFVFLMQADQIQALAAMRATSASAAAPSYGFTSSTDAGMYRVSSAGIGFAHGGVRRFFYTSTAVEFEVATQHINENTVTRTVDTQARTGWRFTNNANQPMWAIYLGTTANNVLSFQRYNSSGTFQDIPFQINQAGGIIRMSTLPTSSAGLVAGELWRNPVSPGFVAII